ncbi:hypothetical protein EJB05_22891, partial [Eragrostis curvula]
MQFREGFQKLVNGSPMGQARMYATIDLNRARVGRPGSLTTTRQIHSGMSRSTSTALTSAPTSSSPSSSGSLSTPCSSAVPTSLSGTSSGGKRSISGSTSSKDKKPLPHGPKIHVRVRFTDVAADHRGWSSGISDAHYPGVPYTFFKQRRGARSHCTRTHTRRMSSSRRSRSPEAGFTSRAGPLPVQDTEHGPQQDFYQGNIPGGSIDRVAPESHGMTSTQRLKARPHGMCPQLEQRWRKQGGKDVLVDLGGDPAGPSAGYSGLAKEDDGMMEVKLSGELNLQVTQWMGLRMLGPECSTLHDLCSLQDDDRWPEGRVPAFRMSLWYEHLGKPERGVPEPQPQMHSDGEQDGYTFGSSTEATILRSTITAEELCKSRQEAGCLIAENQEQLEESRAKCAELEKELSRSRQEADCLAKQKLELVGELGAEKQKMEELRQDIRVISRAFSHREGQLTSLYSKSKAIVEHCKASQVATLP